MSNPDDARGAGRMAGPFWFDLTAGTSFRFGFFATLGAMVASLIGWLIFFLLVTIFGLSLNPAPKQTTAPTSPDPTPPVHGFR